MSRLALAKPLCRELSFALRGEPSLVCRADSSTVRAIDVPGWGNNGEMFSSKGKGKEMLKTSGI